MENDGELNASDQSNAKHVLLAGWFDTIALICAVAATVAAVCVAGASVKSIALGGLAWVCGVLIKAIISAPFHRFPTNQNATYLIVSCLGLLSGISEIGSAVVIGSLFLHDANIVNIIGYGLGAAIIETGILLVEAYAFQGSSAKLSEWEEAAENDIFIRHALFVERITASVLHVGIRTLAFIAFTAGAYFVMFIAILAFSIIDGLGDLGEANGWSWYDRKVFYLYFCSVLLFGLAALVVAFFLS